MKTTSLTHLSASSPCISLFSLCLFLSLLPPSPPPLSPVFWAGGTDWHVCRPEVQDPKRGQERSSSAVYRHHRRRGILFLSMFRGQPTTFVRRRCCLTICSHEFRASARRTYASFVPYFVDVFSCEVLNSLSRKTEVETTMPILPPLRNCGVYSTLGVAQSVLVGNAVCLG